MANGHAIEELADRAEPNGDLLALENGNDDDDLMTQEEKDFLAMVKTVSDELDECTKSASMLMPMPIISIQQQRQRVKVACTSAAAAAVEELQAIMPAAIAICELN